MDCKVLIVCFSAFMLLHISRSTNSPATAQREKRNAPMREPSPEDDDATTIADRTTATFTTQASMTSESFNATAASITQKQEVTTAKPTTVLNTTNVKTTTVSTTLETTAATDKITADNPCDPNPCGNRIDGNSNCTNNGASYTCVCAEGWLPEENCLVPSCEQDCTPGICVRHNECGACGDINLVEPDCSDIRVQGLYGSLIALLTISVSIGLCSIGAVQYKSKKLAVGVDAQQNAL